MMIACSLSWSSIEELKIDRYIYYYVGATGEFLCTLSVVQKKKQAHPLLFLSQSHFPFLRLPFFCRIYFPCFLINQILHH